MRLVEKTSDRATISCRQLPDPVPTTPASPAVTTAAPPRAATSSGDSPSAVGETWQPNVWCTARSGSAPPACRVAAQARADSGLSASDREKPRWATRSGTRWARGSYALRAGFGLSRLVPAVAYLLLVQGLHAAAVRGHPGSLLATAIARACAVISGFEPY